MLAHFDATTIDLIQSYQITICTLQHSFYHDINFTPVVELDKKKYQFYSSLLYIVYT